MRSASLAAFSSPNLPPTAPHPLARLWLPNVEACTAPLYRRRTVWLVCSQPKSKPGALRAPLSATSVANSSSSGPSRGATPASRGSTPDEGGDADDQYDFGSSLGNAAAVAALQMQPRTGATAGGGGAGGGAGRHRPGGLDGSGLRVNVLGGGTGTGPATVSGALGGHRDAPWEVHPSHCVSF